MKIAIETHSGIIFTRDFPTRTYKQASEIMAKEMRKAGWTEVAEIRGISQFKILPEKK